MSGITAKLRSMGFTDDMIARATVDGKPINEVDKPKPSKTPDGMNKTEAIYAAELDWQKREGRVLDWKFESVKLRLADRTWYTPDFCVWLPGGGLRFVETKGFLRDDAGVKFKVAREMFPRWEFLMIRRVKGSWVQVNL